MKHFRIKSILYSTLKASEATKIIQQADSTLKPNMGSYLQENDTKINQQVQEPGDDISKSVSEASKSPVTTSKRSEEYNIPLNQKKGLSGANFITLGKISEEDKIEIIKLGFQLQNQGKISLKKYYESTQEYSLFQLKGYSIKYDTIRRAKLYQQLKP